jgi:hypothetical protein
MGIRPVRLDVAYLGQKLDVPVEQKYFCPNLATWQKNFVS